MEAIHEDGSKGSGSARGKASAQRHVARTGRPVPTLSTIASSTIPPHTHHAHTDRGHHHKSHSGGDVNTDFANVNARRKSVSGASPASAPSHLHDKKIKNAANDPALQSRVFKNDDKMTFGMRVKLAEHPEMWADADLAATHLVDVWNHYDVNKDGILNRNEIPMLARDVVDRLISMYKESIRKEQPTINEQELNRLCQKEIPHLLPGKDIADSKRIMVDYLAKELDVDHDGIITRTEFMFQWKITSKQLLKIDTSRQQPLSCTIL